MKSTQILILAGCIATSSLIAAAKKQPIPVTVAPLSEVVFFPVHTAPATAISLNDARVSAEISAMLADLPVKVGDRVAAGDVVGQLDCRDAVTLLAEARAAYEAGQAKHRFDSSQLRKGKKLAKNKNISGEEVDRRSSNFAVSAAELDRLKASVTKAETSVRRCKVTAPFDAVVVERLASVGDFLQRGQPVVRLLDIDNVEVSANVQEKDLPSLRAAVEFELVTRNESFPLKLRTVLPQMDSRLRSFEARFSFVDEVAVSGSAGRLTWRSPTPHVPADLVVERNGLGIFVLENGGKARFVPFTNAIAGVPVATDLDPATRVVIEGRFNLNDADLVAANER